MLEQYVIDLIIRLERENSPKERLDIIKDFVLDYFSELTTEQVSSLRQVFTAEVDKKRLQGQQAIKKRKFAKNQHKNKFSAYKKPLFVSDYSAHQDCQLCNIKIDSKNAFRWMQNGKYNDFHALPSCFPEADKQLFQNNTKYLQFTKGQNE